MGQGRPAGRAEARGIWNIKKRNPTADFCLGCAMLISAESARIGWTAMAAATSAVPFQGAPGLFLVEYRMNNTRMCA